MTNIFRVSRAPLLCAAVLGLGSMLSVPGAAAESQNSNKIDICHKGRTISVSSRALPGHQRHGDVRGECPNPLEEMRVLSERLMFTCGIVDGAHAVIAATMSEGITADLAEVELTAVNCPEALVVISEGGCEESSQHATLEGQNFLFACPSAADDPPEL